MTKKPRDIEEELKTWWCERQMSIEEVLEQEEDQ